MSAERSDFDSRDPAESAERIDDVTEDLVSILGTSSERIDPSRFHVTFDGNSSEEDNSGDEGETGEQKGDIVVDRSGGSDGDMCDNSNYYTPLGGVEFGEFVGADDDNYRGFTSEEDPYANHGLEPTGRFETEESKNTATTGVSRGTGVADNSIDSIEHNSNSATVPAVSNEQHSVTPTENLVPPSIPPLTQDKIETIKQAMSRITINSPTLGAVAIADALLRDRTKLRLGDEVTTALGTN